MAECESDSRRKQLLLTTDMLTNTDCAQHGQAEITRISAFLLPSRLRRHYGHETASHGVYAESTSAKMPNWEAMSCGWLRAGKPGQLSRKSLAQEAKTLRGPA